MNVIQRIQAPTPKLFKKIRNGGLIFASIGASILAAPGALPPILLKLAGYLTVAGGVATAVSQVVTNGDEQTSTVTGDGH